MSALTRLPWPTALAAAIAALAVAAGTYGAVWDPPVATLAVARAGAKVGWIVLLVLVLWQTATGLVVGSRDSRVSAAASPRTDGRLPFVEILRRALLVCSVPLPRYLADPAGGIVAGFWLLVILPCGFVYVESAVRRRPRLAWLARGYWLAWAGLLVPWAIPALAASWPPGGAF